MQSKVVENEWSIGNAPFLRCCHMPNGPLTTGTTTFHHHQGRRLARNRLARETRPRALALESGSGGMHYMCMIHDPVS